MASKPIMVQSDVLERLQKFSGTSWTKKIENLMEIQTASPVDYDKIRDIFKEVKND